MTKVKTGRRTRPGRTVAVCGASAIVMLGAAPGASAAWQDLGVAAVNAPGRGTTFSMNGRGDLAFGFGGRIENESANDIDPPKDADRSPLLVRRPAGGSWTATTPTVDEGPLRFDDLPDVIDAPGVAVGGDGTATAAWSQFSNAGNDDRVVVAQTGLADGTFPTPARPLIGSEEDSPVRVVALRGGAFAAIWVDGGRVTTSLRNKAGQWTAPKVVGAVTAVRIVDVVVDDAGRLTVVLRGSALDGSTGGIGSITRSAAGTWGPVAFGPKNYTCVGTRGCFYPPIRAAVSGDGTVSVVYSAESGRATGYNREADQVWSASRPAGGSWRPAVKVYENAAPTTNRVSGFSATKYGVLLATWSDADGSIRAAHGDADGRWSAPTQVFAAGTEPRSVENRAQGVVTVLAQTPDGLKGRDFYPWDGNWSPVQSVPTRADVPAAYASTTSGIVSSAGKFFPAPSTQMLVTDRGDTAIVYGNTGARNRSVAVVVDDAGGPQIGGFTIPPSPAPRAAGAFSATALDAFSALGTATWSFGDGTTATGLQTSHAYAKAGTYRVSLTVRDVHGNASTTASRIRVEAPSATARSTLRRVSAPVAPRGAVRISDLAIRTGRLELRASGPAALNVALRRRIGTGRDGRARFAPAGVVQVDVARSGAVTIPVRAFRAGHTYRVVVTRRGTDGPPVRDASKTHRTEKASR